MSQPDSNHLLNAANSLREAYGLIDRLGEFFQAEHTWITSGVVEDDALEWQAWTNKVASRLDYLGFVVPEMYEALIHLAHGLENVLRELSEGDVTGGS